jgi:hypothetical protein
MKFIMFWEYSREDTDKVLQKFQKFLEGIKKNPEKHVKAIFPAHHLGEPSETGMMKGITIYESDDEEKLIDYTVSYFQWGFWVKGAVNELIKGSKLSQGVHSL